MEKYAKIEEIMNGKNLQLRLWEKEILGKEVVFPLENYGEVAIVLQEVGSQLAPIWKKLGLSTIYFILEEVLDDGKEVPITAIGYELECKEKAYH